MKARVLLLVLAGCYGDFRGGATAPTDHGHGGAGLDLEVAGGAQYRTETVELGAGPMFGVHASDTNGYMPFGVQGRLVVALAPLARGSSRNILLVAHAGAAAAVGMKKTPASDGTAPDGRETSFFAGLGVTSATSANGHVAVGLSASRFWPDAGEPFWFLGAAVEISYRADSD